jgi:ankyrin repeat protein
MEKLRPTLDVVYRTSPKICQQLHFAIDRRDEAVVLKLLLQRVDPNILQPGSTLSPLHRAFGMRSAPIATLLAIAGADLDEPTNEGDTALIRGIKCGFSDTFISLICELGARVEAVDNQGCSALHHAAASKLETEDDTIAVLASAGADLNLRDYSGQTPLIAAVDSGRLDFVDRLVEFGADLELRLPSGKTALHVAISKRNSSLVRLLADRGAYLDRRFSDHTALTFAISTGCTEISQILIESGASPNLVSTTGTFPLLSAVAAGNQVVVEALLRCSASVDAVSASGYTPMHMAALKNRLRILQLLTEAGSPLDPMNEQGETPLSIAVSLGYAGMVEYLVLCGADVNHSPLGGESILVSALRSGNTTVAKLLISAGADLIMPDGEDGEITPVHLAAQQGLDDALQAMIDVRVDLEARLWSGYTPLFMAAAYDRTNTTRLLLSHGANKFCRSAAGDSLLCVVTTNPRIMKLLIEQGLDVNHRSESGATALHYAALRGHVASAKVLLKNGARQFHASAVFESVEDWRDGIGYRQGTPAGVARQRGFAQLARLIDKWKFK